MWNGIFSVLTVTEAGADPKYPPQYLRTRDINIPDLHSVSPIISRIAGWCVGGSIDDQVISCAAVSPGSCLSGGWSTDLETEIFY